MVNFLVSVYFATIPLACVSLLMIVSGVKQWGAAGQKDKKLKYGTIKKKADDNDLVNENTTCINNNNNNVY